MCFGDKIGRWCWVCLDGWTWTWNLAFDLLLYYTCLTLGFFFSVTVDRDALIFHFVIQYSPSVFYAFAVAAANHIH